MIPIRDSLSPATSPIANTSLIAIGALVFVGEVLAGDALDGWVEQHGLVPARFFALGARGGYADPALYTPLVTSIFLHASSVHLVANGIFLWIFGDDVEERLGHVGYLGFFLAGGAVAGAAQLTAHPQSVLPTIGASGAVAAVMGAYLLLHPRAVISSFVFPLFWIQFRVPAAFYLVLWFAFQLAMAAGVLGAALGSGVAWWTHAAGFAFGAALAALLPRASIAADDAAARAVVELRPELPASPRRARR